MISTKQNGYQPNPCGIENPVPPKTGSNVDFASYHKKQLVRFCKKFHKDCYRLIGQKMALKDKVAGLEQQIEKYIEGNKKLQKVIYEDTIYIGKLREQIEKMKCCENCNNTWNGMKLDVCTDCKGYSKWKLKEIEK